MWTQSGIESEGQYAFSCELMRCLRFIYEVQTSDHHPWRKTIESILQSFLGDFKSFNRPKEAEILFGLLRGCDFNGLAPYMHAVTANNENLQILGFVDRNESESKRRLVDDFNNKDLRVLAMNYNEKNKEKSDMQIFDPNNIKIVNDAPVNEETSQNQFKITAELLNKLLRDCDLLSSVEEDIEDGPKKQHDIFQLNTRTMIMKLINHQLQNNSEVFLSELKKSDYYQALLKFVCKESSVEMKGEIMLLDWLEYKCFAIRKYACENQQSLTKQREVHASLVKSKLYIQFDNSSSRGDQNITSVALKSAINFKNFEERKELKLIHSNDVYIQESGKSTEKQIVLIDPNSLMDRANGLDILNMSEACITYDADLNKLIKNIFIRQREDRDKYIELAQKTVFLVSSIDYHKISNILHSTDHGNATKSSAPSDDDNFDKIFMRELINYGGFHPSVAKKTLEKEGLGIEKKTELLAELSKMAKEGLIDLTDASEEIRLADNTLSQQQCIKEQEQLKSTLKRPEEMSENLVYLKNSFQNYLDHAHDDKSGNSSRDALYDCINQFNKKDLSSEYERSLIRLFNMYCRHVFWSLIQKDDVHKIFSLILESNQDMKAFSVFLKVLGNECYITGNKVYIKSFKEFLIKVIQACSGQDNKYRKFLTILLQDGLVQAYQLNLIQDLKNDPQQYTQRRIEEFFKTESKASQLMNPFIIKPLLKAIIKHDPYVIESLVDRLVSILICVNCLFIGNYALKQDLWEILVALLEHVRSHLATMDPLTVTSLLNLRIVDALFSTFEDQHNYDRSETEYARRTYLDNSSSKEIDGIPRKEIERLVYAKRVQILQGYMKYQGNKEQRQVLIEMLFKLYQIDKDSKNLETEQEIISRYKYKNNLMSHMEMYGRLIEQGQEGPLNEYLLFMNQKIEDQQLKIVTQTIETSHKEYEGNFSVKVQYPNAEKVLLRLNEATQMKPGASLMISSDQEGQNVIALKMENHGKKEHSSFLNVYGNSFYLHYPVFPHVNYTFSVVEDQATLSVLEQPIYRLIDRFEDHNIGKIFVTAGNKLYLWKNDVLRRYKDHLDIEQVTFGKQCRVFLLKNGKVYGEGRSKAKHLIDSEAENSDVKGVEIPFYEKKDRLIKISTFFQVTIGVSEQGKVFAVGDKLAKQIKLDNQKFGFYEVPICQESASEKKVEEEKKEEAAPVGEEMIDTSTKNVDKTDLFAVRAWACKTATPTDFVFIVLLHHSKKNKTELRTLGNSQYGNLGQGIDIKQSNTFKLIEIPSNVELRSADDIAIGYDNTFIVSNEGKVYGWGSYTPDDKFQFKPVHITYFDDYNIIKIAGSQRSIVLASPKDNPDKKVIIYGKLAPFVQENSVKVFDLFSGLNIHSMQQVGDRLLISTIGTYVYGKPLQNQAFNEKHEQKCTLCSEHSHGILHFFKDKEEKYHYFCIKCVRSGEMAKKYSPDLMWVIKRPMRDLESKPWPAYDPETLLSSETRNVVLYINKTLINGKEFNHQCSLDELIKPSISDVNPMIYLRLARPLKEDAQLDALSLDSFYLQTNFNGVTLSLTPDYGYSELSTAITTKNQQLYTDFKKALDEPTSLTDQKLKQTFKAKIEEFVAKKLKDVSPQDLRLKDLKFTEDSLKFGNEKLDELSEDCKRYHAGKYLQYLQYIWGAYSFLYRDGKHPQDYSLVQIYNANKSKIPLLVKNKILKKLTERLGYDDSSISIHVNRKKARDFIESGKIDEKGEHTVFAQVHRGLSARKYQGMRINTADKKAWFVKFIGEAALDQGGLFRESLTELCGELQSSTLNLLIPTQNQKSKQGEERDKWTVNPSATSQAQLNMYEFLGALIGMSVRSGILMSLNLSSFVWKQLTDETLTINDLQGMDQLAFNLINELKTIKGKITEEEFLQGYDMNFTTILSSGEEFELCKDGKSKRVNFENISEYIDLMIKARFYECKTQIKHIKKGIDITFDSNYLRLLGWKDLQYKVVGEETIDVERLKEITTYRNCQETHDTIKKFWKILNAMPNEDRILYLKFVWGRTRLPLKEEEVTENHVLEIVANSDLNKLPIGRTCFFRLEIPPYKSEESFRDKLLYAIKYCTAIDADIERPVGEEELAANEEAESRRRESESHEENGDGEDDDDNYEDQDEQEIEEE